MTIKGEGAPGVRRNERWGFTQRAAMSRSLSATTLSILPNTLTVYDSGVCSNLYTYRKSPICFRHSHFETINGFLRCFYRFSLDIDLFCD